VSSPSESCGKRREQARLGQRDRMIPSVQVDLFRCSVEEFGGGNRNGGEKSDGR
jgi:hypothetical protein